MWARLRYGSLWTWNLVQKPMYQSKMFEEISWRHESLLFHMQEFQKQLTCLLPPVRWQLALLQKISANLAEWSQWFFRPRKGKTHWQNIRQRRAEQRVLYDSGVCLQFLGKSCREGVNFGDVKSKWYWKEIPFDTSLIAIYVICIPYIICIYVRYIHLKSNIRMKNDSPFPLYYTVSDLE